MKGVALLLEMYTCKNHNVNPLVVSLPSMSLQVLNSISNNLLQQIHPSLVEKVCQNGTRLK